MELVIFGIGIFVVLRYLYWRRKYHYYKKNKWWNPPQQSKWQTNKEKGNKYEHQILRHYKKQGYKVYPQGFIKGKADSGIDLIAYKGNEALLIQCKNWEYSQVKQEHLRIFLGDCTAYLEKNQKIFAKKNVRRVFITSCKNLDYGVKKFIMENNMEYKVISYMK